MGIKVMVAFSNRLFSEGVSRLLENDETIKVDRLLDAGVKCTEEELSPVDVILTDFTSLYNSFPDPDASKRQNFILIDTGCGRENITSAIMARNISGVLMDEATAGVLKKAIRAVARGDIWIDQATVRDLLKGVAAFKRERPDSLSEKEKDVAALIGIGLRNKEIAQRLKISEFTVKTHLHKIFKKLEIRSRSELVKHSLKSGFEAGLFGKRN